MQGSPAVQASSRRTTGCEGCGVTSQHAGHLAAPGGCGGVTGCHQDRGPQSSERPPRAPDSDVGEPSLDGGYFSPGS